MALLEQINNPDDLKKFSIEEIKLLSSEIRDYINTVIPAIGGHFASSLGTVELTLALHYVFNTPEDKIVWDVGHQAYVHKILTGRRERLKTIRQKDGISGFLKPSESEYDSFGAGHASTSISAALGMAVARDIAKKDFKVVSVIGDGGITGGLAYEGLNNAGMQGKDMIIILNDNNMSISPNVGAISQYLTNIITNPFYNRIKTEIWELTGKIPSVSKQVRLLARRMEESFKNLIVPGMLFEDLGLKYFGPIDGHNVNELISVFSNVTKLRGPVLIHVITRKGKGIDHAEADPCKYHGVKPPKSSISTPSNEPASYSYTNIFGNALVKFARSDKKIVAITAAMAEGTGLVEFRNEFPERFFDVGIAEGHAVTFAGGLMAEGFKPVVSIYSTFLQRAYDHIIHDIAIQKLPVVFTIDRAGLVGEDGPTHHGCFDLSYLTCIPNTVVCAPKDGQELQDLLYTALQFEEGPFFIRYPRDVTTFSPDITERLLLIGSWETLRPGKDIAILAVGSMVQEALNIAEKLYTFDIDTEVINCRFVKPLDEKLLRSLAGRFSKLVTLEENTVHGGFGSFVANHFQTNLWDSHQFLHMGLPDNFVTHGKRSQLLDTVGLSREKIERRIFQFLDIPLPQNTENLEYIS